MTDYTLTEAMRKACIEYGGDKVHGIHWLNKCFCGEVDCTKTNRTFAGPNAGNDMIWLVEAIERKGEWEAFWGFARSVWVDIDDEYADPLPGEPEGATFSRWLNNPSRFCWLVAQGLEAEIIGKDKSDGKG